MNDEKPLGVAAFDFDGTLIANDSFVPFLVRLRGARKLGWEFSASCLSLLRAGGWKLDRDVSKADLVARLLAGYPADRLAEEGEAFGLQLARRIRPHMSKRLDWHRDQGHRVLLVSASLQAYLEPLGRSLGLDAVLATRLEVGPDGRLTGRLEGVNCRGPEKEVRVREWLAGNANGAAVELWAYGDSTGDRELLAMADYPQLIRRRDQLRLRLTTTVAAAP